MITINGKTIINGTTVISNSSAGYYSIFPLSVDGVDTVHGVTLDLNGNNFVEQTDSNEPYDSAVGLNIGSAISEIPYAPAYSFIDNIPFTIKFGFWDGNPTTTGIIIYKPNEYRLDRVNFSYIFYMYNGGSETSYIRTEKTVGNSDNWEDVKIQYDGAGQDGLTISVDGDSTANTRSTTGTFNEMTSTLATVQLGITYETINNLSFGTGLLS